MLSRCLLIAQVEVKGHNSGGTHPNVPPDLRLIFISVIFMREMFLSMWAASAGDEKFWGGIVFNLAKTFVSCTACNCYHADKNTEM